ncbi:MAG: preprotein translocase subunit YajC [Wolbachia endosymbiont of Homalodisca vitripennis]|uniref:Sec translocon accessory complex subunit YajC n=1 Tax=Wolbachia endosymbiont of Aleurodicus dispersus TaxID=1288877 RepID=A0A3B0JC10_9RICK|nr:preprotein translocase subunit YajC [Wolbachia endosymbiont of Homalodisca vitripennis]MCJ7454483.1 preprotein translocase subunit YajC [Wolbachia endosymbiont of Homalodisca vitripennis]MCJ7476159.1 preprotein translocase subunit YajC [Wolbachia endosymbiont of Homalodisca vitripennis]
MFISEVFAADTTNNVSASVASFIPLILVFVVFYFLIIRPNHKKLKEHRRMIDQIKRGDTVITSSGIIGEVNKVDEVNAQLILEIAPKIEIKILKSAISEILNKEIQKPVAKSIEKSKVEKNGKKNKLEESKKDKNAS